MPVLEGCAFVHFPAQGSTMTLTMSCSIYATDLVSAQCLDMVSPTQRAEPVDVEYLAVVQTYLDRQHLSAEYVDQLSLC